MQDWISYHFFESRDEVLPDFAFSDVTCSCNLQGRLILADKNGTLTVFPELKSEPTTIAFSTDPIVAMKPSQYSSSILIVTKNSQEFSFTVQNIDKNEVYAKATVPVTPENEDIKFISASPKLARFAVSFDGKKILLFAIPEKSREKTLPRPQELFVNDMLTNLIVTNDLTMKKHIFYTTVSSIGAFQISTDGKIKEVMLDSYGAKPKGACITDKGRLAVSNGKVIKFYTRDGVDSQAQHVELDIEPIQITWYRSYLVSIVPLKSRSNDKKCIMKFFELETHCIFGNIRLEAEPKFVVYEWGSIIILQDVNKFLVINEFDTGKKVHNLCTFNKQYEIALKLSKIHHLSEDIIADIHRQIGDARLSHRDFNGAIDEYIQAIGFLEPSHVITQLLEPQHAEYLVRFLEALHTKGKEESYHTTLRFNCYTKLKRADALSRIVSQSLVKAKNNEDPGFDVDAAISVLSGGGFTNEAVQLAKAFRRHNVFCQMMSRLHNYSAIADHIQKLSATLAKDNIIKYGPAILSTSNEKERELFTLFVVKACTEGLITKEGSSELKKLSIDPLFPTFLEFPLNMYMYFSQIFEKDPNLLSEDMWNRLLSYCASVAPQDMCKYIQSPMSKYSDEYALLVLRNTISSLTNQLNDMKAANPNCDSSSITNNINILNKALVTIYEHRECYKEVLSIVNPTEIPALCRKYSLKDSFIWVEGLRISIDSKDLELIRQMVDTIVTEGYLHINETLQMLSKSSICTYDLIGDFFIKEFERMQKSIDENVLELENIDKSIAKSDADIIKLSTNYFPIKPSRCAQCNSAITLPARHFKCGHSYHLSCLGDESDYCTKCRNRHEENARLMCNQFDEFHAQSSVIENMNESKNGSSLLLSVLETGLMISQPDEEYEKQAREFYMKISGQLDE